jgi:hypothetical protein
MLQYASNQLHIMGAIVCDAEHSALTWLSITGLIALPDKFLECDMFAESVSTLKILTSYSSSEQLDVTIMMLSILMHTQ